MPTTIHHEGKDIDVCVEIDVHGFLHLRAFEDGTAIAGLPPMTPFEASMLARDLSRAAEKADTKG